MTESQLVSATVTVQSLVEQFGKGDLAVPEIQRDLERLTKPR